ncbi:ubiquitin-conjugating enzyme [Babesia ovata]|uniref:Ubiquitin-conjugating enzyme n=1 Tax=Babesia ovata TaxID=189622 RepID=A0A2H6KD21_9APIC|nr:ubiquitin-conjugating enzyme [Babesia ovata]GBE60896.1 ubiquitin-conjugating enzyme [Babesia ovata]
MGRQRVDYVRDFVSLQQRTHLTALKLMVRRALPSQQYHQEVFRKSREIERKFEKLKSSVKGDISNYNIKVHRIVARLRRVRHSIRAATSALVNLRRSTMGGDGRLLKELKESSRMDDPNMRLMLVGSNVNHWYAYIRGPEKSPYEPPMVTFVTKCFHPNINFETGELCMDVLKSNWSPAWTLQYLCRGVSYILDDPNADSPLNCDAGNLIRSGDIVGFRSMAEMYTLDYALQSFP